MKLRPDLQALVDAELERARGLGVPEGVAARPAPCEPYFVDRASPLYDAINVRRALEAHVGRCPDLTARGMPWPENVEFPRADDIVPPEEGRTNAESSYATASSDGVRDVMVRAWADAPWVVAENYGGMVDWPSGTGLAVKRGARGDKVLGVGRALDTSRRFIAGKIEVDGVGYYAKAALNTQLERDGFVYDVPVLEITGKVKVKR